MKVVFTALAAAAALGLAACVNVTTGHASAPSSASRSATSPASAPTASAQQSPVTPSAPASTSTQPSAPSASPANVPNVTDPWAVVSAHYGDIESGDYAQAWALISSGAVTGQTYQQFVNGFARTGAQQLTELSESGDQVTFDLAATNSCTGAVQHFTGTDTVQNGRIVAAHVTQTG